MLVPMFLNRLTFGWLSLFGGTIFYSIPKFKIQISTAAAAEFLFLNFAKYQYVFNTNFQSSKFGRASGQILNFELC